MLPRFRIFKLSYLLFRWDLILEHSEGLEYKRGSWGNHKTSHSKGHFRLVELRATEENCLRTSDTAPLSISREDAEAKNDK